MLLPAAVVPLGPSSPATPIMLAFIVGFFYFYAELLRLELQMILHPDEYKLSKFML